MASPFAIFRKNQKAMYALLTVMCMIGFSASSVFYDSDRMGGGEDPVVATANGEAIRAREVQQLLRRRRLVISFLAECKAAEFNLPDVAQWFVPHFEMTFGPATQQAVVDTWLLDNRALQMGIVISDSAINKYLKDLTGDKVKSQKFGEIAQRLDVGQSQLFDALRAELRALRLQEMAVSRLQTTPAQRWDYYRRQRQRATVEVAALPVEQFVDEVPDATTEQLQAFFDAHKEAEPNPESPTPGFKVPKKADFQVVVAKYNDFYDEKSVTEEQIKKHYEDFKETRYLWEQYALSGESDWEASDLAPSKTTEGGEPPADKPANDESPATDSPSEPSDEKSESKADARPDSSWRLRPGLREMLARPSSLVAGWLFADEERESAAEDTATADKAKSESAKSESAKSESAKSEGEQADESSPEKTADAEKKNSSAEEKPAKTEGGKSAPEKPKDAKPSTKIAPPVGDELVLPRDIRQGPHPKHAPLWKVEEVIRRELAREAAEKKIEDALTVIRDKMRKYARRLSPDAREEKMPDLDKLAGEHGLSELETGLVTARELMEKFPALAEAKGERGSPPFVDFAYGSMARFQSTTVQDLEANRYLVWKVEEQDAFVPELAEVRAKVLRVWKLIQARDLAIQKAKALAGEADKSGKSLKTLFADREGLTINQPPSFSWMTRGSANVDNRAPLEISPVEGVDSAGPDFMREVFSLSVGSVGAALNEPKTTAYVVRLVSLDPSYERLHTGFMTEPFPLYIEVAREDMAQLQRAWLKGIEAEANLTWKDVETLER